jgi:DNA-binding MarR family transcriptional regulator
MSQTPEPAVATALTERAGFLLSALGFYAAERFTQRLAPLGLAPRHFGLLTHLALRDGQSQQQLAEAMGIHRNAMVGLLDDLEARELVERRRHPADRRAHAIHLTPAARELLPQARAAADDHDTELLTSLDEADRYQLISLLQKLAGDARLVPGVHPGLREFPPACSSSAENGPYRDPAQPRRRP